MIARCNMMHAEPAPTAVTELFDDMALNLDISNSQPQVPLMYRPHRVLIYEVKSNLQHDDTI